MCIIEIDLIAELRDQIASELQDHESTKQLFAILEQLGLTNLGLDLEQHFDREREIAIIWGIQDVLDLCPRLSRHQAWRVLSFIYHNHEAKIGMNWETIDLAAETLYPDAEERTTHADENCASDAAERRYP